jgi:uridine kinase
MARFIAIDGHGGSGKSTLAETLATEFDAEIIHTDDFASYENNRTWWPLIVEHVFKPIKHGAKTLNYPRSKWSENHNPEPVVDQPVTKVMILEGVSALRTEFRQYIDFGIFVDTPEEVFLQRGFERDQGQDSKSDEELRKIWQAWRKEELEYMRCDNPKDYADLIVDGTKPASEAVQTINKLLTTK